jgi:hypothetical protein
MRSTIFMLLLVSTFSNAFGDEFDPKPVRAAINRAIPWLEKDMVTWRESNGCAACHHGPMYLWSGHIAKRQGYQINEQQLQEYAKWILQDEDSRVFPKGTPAPVAISDNAADKMTAQMMGHNNLSQPTLYLAHALNAFPPKDALSEAGWQKLEQHWLEAQMENGSFAGRIGRPPIFNSPQILTLFAATALQDRLAVKTFNREQGEPLERIHQKAVGFLNDQTPDRTHQGLILRVLMPTQLRGDRNQIIHDLVAMQHEDGGWSQTPDSPSDAFATGQSLYVLSRAEPATLEMAVAKGLMFLAKSQADDGTWPMTSRAHPETGQPADDLNPITYAATAWATIGMTSHVKQEQ